MDLPIHHDNHANLAHEAGIERLRECFEYMWHWDEYGDHEPSAHPGEQCPVDVSAAPFDGCDVCQVREVLHAAAPYMVHEVSLDVSKVEHGAVTVVRSQYPLPSCVSDNLADVLLGLTKPAALLVVGMDMSIESLDEVALNDAGWYRR